MKLSDFDTLAEAKVYEKTEPKLIHRDSMNSLLASAGMYVALKGVAEDATNANQNLIAAFLDSVEYNFMIGNSTGDRQIAALDSIIAGGGTLGLGLESIKPYILAMANPTTRPFENSTQYNFKQSKGTLDKVSVTVEKGFCTITTTADCETHNPQIHQKITFDDGAYIYKRVAGFNAVSTSGVYRTQCPALNDLYVDDAYGVITTASA